MSQETRTSKTEQKEAPAEVDENLAQTAGKAAAENEVLKEETKDVLDFLDYILEDVNAEEFVAGFVQKGGQ